MPRNSTPPTLAEARAAKVQATSVLEAIPGVVGIGITRVGEGYGLKVNLQAALPPDVHVPDLIDGVPLRVEVVGVPKKQ